MDLLAYALGGLVIAALVHWWRPAVSWRVALAYLAAAGAFFILPLATPALQVGSDIPYVWRPWSETIPPGTHRPQNPLLGDVPLQLLPYRSLVRERLLSLEAPLWVHEVGIGARPAGAALAALSYAFSAFLVVWAYHPQAMTAAWLPGVLLGLVLLRRGERGGFAGLVACGLGMALSGHP